MQVMYIVLVLLVRAVTSAGENRDVVKLSVLRKLLVVLLMRFRGAIWYYEVVCITCVRIYVDVGCRHGYLHRNQVFELGDYFQGCERM